MPGICFGHRKEDGGVGGIRTHDPAQHRVRDFQSRSFDHSDTTPRWKGDYGAFCPPLRTGPCKTTTDLRYKAMIAAPLSFNRR